MSQLLGNKLALSPSEALVAGALSGASTRALTAPFDVAKIRLQLQISKKNKLIRDVTKIFKDEGVHAFWKGHTAAQLLSIVYTGVHFGVFTKVSEMMTSEEQSAEAKPLISLISGGIAGLLATCFSTPIDTVRTRMVMQKQTKAYSNTYCAFASILRTEGLLGLYRGFTPNMVQVAPLASLQFGTYTSCILLYAKLQGVEEVEQLTKSESFVFGALSGTFAKFVVLPLDVTKKRLQVQGFGEVIKSGGLEVVPAYTGVLHCVTTVWKQEGVRGLYKGAVPSLLKAFVTTGMSFMTFNLFVGVISASKALC